MEGDNPGSARTRTGPGSGSGTGSGPPAYLVDICINMDAGIGVQRKVPKRGLFIRTATMKKH